MPSKVLALQYRSDLQRSREVGPSRETWMGPKSGHWLSLKSLKSICPGQALWDAELKGFGAPTEDGDFTNELSQGNILPTRSLAIFP